MKLIDIISDKVIELPLIEMAYTRRDARHHVQNVSYTLVYHIVKIIIMPNSQYVNHWLTEINGYLSKLNTISIKPKAKRLTYEQYWEWLVEDPGHNNISKDIKRAKEDYPNEKIKLPNNLRQQVHEIIHNMCVDLANNQVKRIREYFK